MKSHRIAFAFVTISFIAVSGGAAAALSAPSSAASTTALSETSPVISQALPGQGSIVGPALLGTSTNVMLTSTASTTATASATIGAGVLSEHNKLAISGSCVVTSSTNQKTCNMSVMYTDPAGKPVIGVPVTIATMNGEGSFTSVTGPLLIKIAPGKVIQYSGNLPGSAAQDVAAFIVSADATNTLFVALTPDGLRAQSNFASSTSMQ
jgi:hypothetical protein